MNLKIDNKNFIVTGATSGFGNAVAMALISNGSNVILNARNENNLKKIQKKHPSQVNIISGDITQSETINKLIYQANKTSIDGIFINAGGPPAKTFIESTIEEWDVAYKNVVRWKIELTKKLLPIFEKQKYGRIVYLESASIKQPIENLVFSNSLRMAVVGFVKTMALEIAQKGITCNILAPGYHLTSAVDRLIDKKSELNNITKTDAENIIITNIPVGKMGNPEGIGELAAWLLSPISEFITGQTFIIDGGMVKATL